MDRDLIKQIRFVRTVRWCKLRFAATTIQTTFRQSSLQCRPGEFKCEDRCSKYPNAENVRRHVPLCAWALGHDGRAGN